MNYKKSYVPKEGFTKLCEIGKCSLNKLEFGMIELSPGGSVMFETGDRETAFIILSGRATFAFDDCLWENVGQRRNVFEGAASAVYMPRNKTVRISTDWNVKMAVCQTPIDEDTAPQLILPKDVNISTLGVKPWERESHFIVDGRSNSKRLCIGEGFATPGNWSGFPPHKHDTDNMPAEGVLDEIYYFQFLPSQGFGFQRLYTSDREIDEVYTVETDDLVEFPRGYHTTVGAPGYSMYLLWLMAGDHQGFFRSSDPEHEWVTSVESMIKKL